MRRVEIPDFPQEGADGSAGGLALPFRIPLLEENPLGREAREGAAAGGAAAAD